MLILTSEKINDIINFYTNGESVLSLSKKYNCTTQDIQNILNKNNIPKVSQAKRKNPNLIEDYFKNIDTNEKAYWLGWMLTDGGVTKNGDIEIAISKKDKYILELLEKDLCISGHVRPFGDHYVRFSLGSINMCNDLEQYGIIPNKTLNLNFPKNIPNEFESHLLRGMFDGDGGFSIGYATRFYKHRNKSYTKQYREFSFTGTYDMCKGFHDILLKYTDFVPKNINKNNNIFRVRWSSVEDILNICNVLYKDCNNHYLIRKYELYQQLIKENSK